MFDVLSLKLLGKLSQKNQVFQFKEPQTSNLELQTFSIAPFRWGNLFFLHH